MKEYRWTIQLGGIRIGWVKYKHWNHFYEHYYRGYIRIGHLDFYNERKFDGSVVVCKEETK